VNEATAPRWLVLATRPDRRAPGLRVVQTSALAVGLLALVLLVLLRTDLIASWRQATPPDAPNRFVINVMPEQSGAFVDKLRGAGVKRLDWYPMFRGRLVAVNGRSVSPDDFAETARGAWWTASSTSLTRRSSLRTTRWWPGNGRPRRPGP
jgi:putative ABC transport system permease protein